MAEKEKKERKENEEKAEEKKFTVGLQKVYGFAEPRRMKKARTLLQRFAFKHCRVSAENVFFSNGLNQALWAHGREHPPRKISVKILLKGGKARVFLEGEKIELPEKEKKERGKEEKKTEEQIQAKEEAEKKLEEKKLAEKAAEAAAMKRGK
ncbi:MAG: hypothetical protein NTW59_02715 [Candidatus Diapherotrites archaeon]|nr:hypothetical protein [Candidatus Diapherotrites archaeon]